MNQTIHFLSRLIPPVLFKVMGRSLFYSLLSLSYFAAGILGDDIPKQTQDILISFCLGQGVFLTGRLLIFLVFTFAMVILYRSTEKQPLWDVYYNKILVAGDILLAVILALNSQTLESFFGDLVVSAMIANYIFNLSLQIFERIDARQGQAQYRIYFLEIAAFPAAMVLGLISFLLWASALDRFEATSTFTAGPYLIAYPVAFHAAGWYYLLQLSPYVFRNYFSRPAPV